MVIKIPNNIRKIVDNANGTEWYIKYRWNIKFTFYAKNKTGGNIAKTIVPKFIRYIQKICDYENAIFPIYRIVCEIEDKYHKLLYEYRNKALCVVKLTKEIYKASEIASDGGFGRAKPEYKEKEFSETFIPFFHGLNAEYMDEDKSVDIESTTEPKNNELSDGAFHTVTVELNHFGTESMNKKIYNLNVANAEPMDVVGLLLSKDYANVDGALIDAPDNANSYPYIIIPPRNLRNALHWIQNQWGLYVNRPIFFCDLKFFYVLKSTYLDHEYLEGEVQTTRVLIRTNPTQTGHTPNVSYVESEKDAFYYYTDQVPKKDTESSQLSEIIADKTVISNFDLANNAVDVSQTKSGDKATTKDPVIVADAPLEQHEQSSKKISSEYDSTNNLYNAIANNRHAKRQGYMIINVNGIDIRSFTPNKQVSLKVVDNKGVAARIDNNYCIRGVAYTFTPIDMNADTWLMTCSANVSLVRGFNLETSLESANRVSISAEENKGKTMVNYKINF